MWSAGVQKSGEELNREPWTMLRRPADEPFAAWRMPSLALASIALMFVGQPELMTRGFGYDDDDCLLVWKQTQAVGHAHEY